MIIQYMICWFGIYLIIIDEVIIDGVSCLMKNVNRLIWTDSLKNVLKSQFYSIFIIAYTYTYIIMVIKNGIK